MLQDEVTVVIPTKDRPQLLALALRSVLEQQDVRLRVVVVDDGSSVPVPAGLRADPRVRVLRQPLAVGVCAARNLGLAAVESPWVAFLDDDDLWAPRKLRRQLDVAAATGHRWVCSAAVTFRAGQLLDIAELPESDDVSRAVLRGNVIPGSASSVLAEADLVRAVGGFDPSLPSMEDWDLWVRLAQASPIGRVAATDVAQRVHASSRGHDLGHQPQALWLMQAKHLASDPPLVVDPEPSFFEYWARMEYGAGDWAGGLRRTAWLVLRRGRLRAVRTPLVAALPVRVQRRLRERRMSARARQHPDLDWSWIAAYAGDAPAVP